MTNMYEVPCEDLLCRTMVVGPDPLHHRKHKVKGALIIKELSPTFNRDGVLDILLPVYSTIELSHDHLTDKNTRLMKTLQN